MFELLLLYIKRGSWANRAKKKCLWNYIYALCLRAISSIALGFSFSSYLWQYLPGLFVFFDSFQTWVALSPSRHTQPTIQPNPLPPNIKIRFQVSTIHCRAVCLFIVIFCFGSGIVQMPLKLLWWLLRLFQRCFNC